jgi:ubiquinone/menaquinone biosynthesis C-methylase UbiE
MKVNKERKTMGFISLFVSVFATTLAVNVQRHGKIGNITVTDVSSNKMDSLREVLLNQEITQKVQLVQNVVQVMLDENEVDRLKSLE